MDVSSIRNCSKRTFWAQKKKKKKKILKSLHVLLFIHCRKSINSANFNKFNQSFKWNFTIQKCLVTPISYISYKERSKNLINFVSCERHGRVEHWNENYFEKVNNFSQAK